MPAPKKTQKSYSYKLLFTGILFISLSSLAFEITLTRIFSVRVGYHFTYLVISIALLGYGTAGTFLKMCDWLKKISPGKLLSFSAFFFAITVLGSYIVVNTIEFDPAQIGWSRVQLIYLSVIFLILFVPFFFSGLTVGFSMYMMSDSIGTIYFYDLTGAGIGCFVPLLLFSFLTGEQVVAAVLLLGLISCFFFSIYFKAILRYIIPALGSFFLILLIVNPSFMNIRISPSRDLMIALRHADAKILQTKWDPYTRLDIVDSPAVRYAPGLSLRYLKPLPPQIGITVDAGNLHAVTSIEENSMGFIGRLTSSAPYMTASPQRIFIYDHAGGLDILGALYHDAARIDATQTNKSVSGYVKEFYRANSSEKFDFARVDFLNFDGREFLKSTDQKYDMVVLSLTNALGASSAAFSSGEDYRYTVEALKEYYSALEENGYISITGYLKPVVSEEAKILATILEAVPNAQILSLRSFATITTIVKKGMVTDEEINRLIDFCKENNFDLVYFPGMDESYANQYNRFPEPVYFNLYSTLLNKNTRDEFIEGYIFDITPARDDKPFFYNYFALDRLRQILDNVSNKFPILIQGGYLVPLVTLLAFVLSFLIILLPAFFKKKKVDQKMSGKANAFAIIYFITIGAAFMFVEIPFIHRLIPVFGNPVYSITIVLFSVLISSGLGSLFQERHIKNKKKAIIYVLISISLILLLYAAFMDQFLSYLIGITFIFRVLIAIAFLFPLGFLMGMPFPVGMCFAKERDRELISWLWCANGCSSVVFASFSIALASFVGYSTVTMLAASAYILALVLLIIYLKASPVIGTKVTPSR